MKNHTSFQAVLKVALILAATTIAGCPAGDDAPADDDTTTTDDTTGTSPTTTSPTTTSPTTTSPTTTTPDTESTETVDPDSSGTESTSTGEDPFVFPEDPYSDYIQIDRHGAVEAGTAGILASAGLGLNGEDLSVRDDYNASNPQDDVDGVWLSEIAASVTFFVNNVGDDITAAGLPAATISISVDQAGPVIRPDTIKYDPSMATSYPNGRALEDQVVDITLAAVLVDLTTGPDAPPLSILADQPINPIANDVPFEAEFPYLAPPHNP